MWWFKIVLLVIFGLKAIGDIAQAGGWKPKPLSPVYDTISAILNMLIFVAIWAWL